MSEAVKKNNRSAGASASAVVPRLFVLELNAGRIHSMNTDGSRPQDHCVGLPFARRHRVDAEAGHIYWTNMGIPSLNDGSVERADIDGKNRKTIVPEGETHTPKQIILDKKAASSYWCDREGMRVMRCNLDGSRLETLSEAGRGEADRQDQTRWCVGLTIDPNADISTGRKKAQTMPGSAASSRPMSKCPPARLQRPGPTSRFLRPSAGADRYRARPQEPCSLLDRPRRPSARQQREPGLDRQQAWPSQRSW